MSRTETWAEFADRFAEEMLTHDITSAMLITHSNSEDRFSANYFNANRETRWMFIGYMIENAVMDAIEANKNQIREILDAGCEE